jgi:hypothetical protein
MRDDVGPVVDGLYRDGRWDAALVHRLIAGCQPEYPWIRADLDPPADAEAVSRFEDLHDVRLPEAYRSFVLDVGAGGAGPNYGLFTFDRSTVAEKLPGWSWSVFLGEDPTGYRTPFAHSVAWNTAELLDADEPSDAYYLEAETNGTWLLSDYGCAIWEFIVINGKAYGEIWRDQRTDGKGLYPLTRKSDAGTGRHGFDSWYTDWLSSCIDDQFRTVEIRVDRSALPVPAWSARLIHNEIRRHDAEHRFLFAAGESTRLFNLDRLNPDERMSFGSLLGTLAHELADRTAALEPLHPDLTYPAAARLLESLSDAVHTGPTDHA